jgi:hypothetical protein
MDYGPEAAAAAVWLLAFPDDRLFQRCLHRINFLLLFFSVFTRPANSDGWSPASLEHSQA